MPAPALGAVGVHEAGEGVALGLPAADQPPHMVCDAVDVADLCAAGGGGVEGGSAQRDRKQPRLAQRCVNGQRGPKKNMLNAAENPLKPLGTKAFEVDASAKGALLHSL